MTHLSRQRCSIPPSCLACGAEFTSNKALAAHRKTCRDDGVNDNDNNDEMEEDEADIVTNEAPNSPPFDASDDDMRDIGLDFDLGDGGDGEVTAGEDIVTDIVVPVTEVSHEVIINLENESVKEDLMAALEEADLDDDDVFALMQRHLGEE